MRNRSMSVFEPKESTRLSMKFEGVVSDDIRSDTENEDLADESAAEAEIEDQVISENWTQEDYDLLLEKLHAALPKRDVRKIKTSLQAIDWDKIELPNHSPEEVKEVSLMLISKVRPFKTLTEILKDVPKVVHKLLEADKPKMPMSAYNIFFKTNLPRWKEQNDLKPRELFKYAASEYQNLSEKKRRKYEDEAARLKAEYKEKMEKYKKTNPVQSKANAPKVIKGLAKTPFNLFYYSRREISSNITLQQARKEWETLAVKNKIKYIKESFEMQSESKLNKKEQEILDRYHGKPDFVGRNPYDYFMRKLRPKYEEKNIVGTERERLMNEDYKKLTEQQTQELKLEYADAREKYIVQYRVFIQNLPPEKREAEIQYLQSMVDKGKKGKEEKRSIDGVKTIKAEERHSVPAEEDPPAAESTTIQKPEKENKSKKKKANPAPEPETRDVTPPRQPNKKAKVVSPVKVVEKKSSKQNDEAPSNSVGHEDKSTTSKNGKGDSKKRSSPEGAPLQVTEKKKPKVEKQATPAMKEPERPPKVIEEFYRQRVYKGKVGKHLESFANLSATKKTEIANRMKQAQKQYLVDFERFLKSLPKDRIQDYVLKMNAQKKGRKSESEEDEEESGSSGSSEEEDDN
ncbi:nucleolar transcription factor 1-like [Toxorhynchites rutilus septentrionalis]|uniref:nucleolar transcription factor 1-like n=1 Tax=Toxorhynchites rutilus septentrionalis TaxID=329112 RepID=UPI0024783DE7|nr:nucleolar transcription factor 1-like [Toxorhynchites rutilus septentrionalis]